MFGQAPDSLAMLAVRIAVGDSHNDGSELLVLTSRRGEHRGGKSLTFLIPESEENRHDAPNVRLKANILLDVESRRRSIGGDREFARLSKMLLRRRGS